MEKQTRRAKFLEACAFLLAEAAIGIFILSLYEWKLAHPFLS